MYEKVELKPGVRDTLARLRAEGARMCVCSNTWSSQCRTVLTRLGIDGENPYKRLPPIERRQDGSLYRMTPAQRKQANALIRRECCNYCLLYTSNLKNRLKVY